MKFDYTVTPQIRDFLEVFRDMVNEAIRISVEENIRGRLVLRNRIYKEFQERYRVVSRYPYAVAEVAWSIVKKHRRWNRRPAAKHLMLKMDSENYSLNYSMLSLPFRKGQRILIPLSYGNYQRSFLMDSSLKRGSVTLTESAVTISFTKLITPVVPSSKLGIDINQKSLVCSDGTEYDLSEVARLHTEYEARRNKFYRVHPRDLRLRAKFAGSRREKPRVRQHLHRVAKSIVEKAISNKQAIILEKLKGIGYRHQRGNREAKSARRRISQWPFHVLQAFIVYKAKWASVPLEFVNPALTSKICHECSAVNRNLKLTEKEWRCPYCGAILDRDLNAAINIERRGKVACLGEVRPGAHGTDEAMRGNPTTPAILRAEALKSFNLGGVPPIVDRTV